MIGKEANIIVTGAAGFIGSVLAARLNRLGFYNLILVDEFGDQEKNQNLREIKFLQCIEREMLFNWLKESDRKISLFYHLGARTDTTEFDYAVHQHLNVDYSEKVWAYCSGKQIPLVYASSAATYGSGELGYSDDHALIDKLQPLNPYGVSKNEFDKWALVQDSAPPFWAGLKFFNVYGPNENHKARMASVIFHAFHQITKTGRMKLFKSYLPAFADGEQLRDFIYVEDIVNVCLWLMEKKPASGIYNLGTGRARSFHDLVMATFAAMEVDPDIEFIEMPEDIRDKYQYFTQADMSKLISAGYDKSFTGLEEGVADYVRNYLVPQKNFNA
jgi:ADP-L-glycero-D-manno-heptose 6-epimerase